MAACVALLRAINVGNRRIGMADLVRLAADLDLGRPKTILQAGSLAFDAGRASPAALETKLEAGIKDRFGIESEVMIRTRPEWRALIDGNPFAREAEADPSHLLIYSLKAAASAKGIAELAAWPGPERVASAGRDLYLVYPDGIGRSKLTAVRIDRVVGAAGTGRNWNTALKILAAMDG
jgi:uncharacterized protein (DUF1697 family)